MNSEEFSLRLRQNCAVTPGMHVLAAVSGGADSMALLCFLIGIRSSYPLEVSCAHIEHGIRAEASLEDMRFVREFCQTHGVAFYPMHADVPAIAQKMGCGIEQAGRIVRRRLLEQTADRIGADVIALAHHAQDQAETVLLHAIRGSDMNGLCAMRWRSGRLIRPLLDMQPLQLRDDLCAMGQIWREDETNTDVQYARNRIRRRVMPELERISLQASRALCRTAQAAQRDEDYFAAVIRSRHIPVKRLVDGAAIEKRHLTGDHPAILSRILVRLVSAAGIDPQSARAIEEVMNVLDREDAAVNLSGSAHAAIGKQYVCVTKQVEEIEETFLAVPGRTDTPFGCFLVREAWPEETGDGLRSQIMPLSALENACVTSRRDGDVMVPFGRHTPVKLKRIMIDAGIERALRKSIPIIRNKSGILWAVGLRPGESCRVEKQDMAMLVEYCEKEHDLHEA